LFLTAALTNLVTAGKGEAVNLDPAAMELGIEASRLRAARERARAIYEMATTLSATLDYNKVLDAALDVGVLGLREMKPGTRLIGMVVLFRGDHLYVATSRRLTRADERVTMEGKAGVIGLALKQAEPVFASTVTEDPELRYFVAFQEAKSVLAIPLRAGFDNYGVLVYGATDVQAFSDEHIELLTAIGTQATIAMQNAVLYKNLQNEKERIIEVEEDARKKLARDLHDGPTQTVAAIAMRVNYIRRLIETKPQSADEELQKVEELARRTTKEIRHMLFTLRPLVLETQGLSPALKQFAEKMKETHDLVVTLQLQQGVDEHLESHRQGILFYIIEEAVGNARKHAQAQNIYVRLYRRDRMVIAEIQDDGVGFDVDSVTSNYEKRGSLGMVNMRERVALVEGQLHIDSAKGKGTKISIAVPITDPMTPAPGSPRQTQRQSA
jgi:signal transduction histidine kinase